MLIKYSNSRILRSVTLDVKWLAQLNYSDSNYEAHPWHNKAAKSVGVPVHGDLTRSN